MTASQIKYEVVTVLGYQMNVWTDLAKVTMIYLDQDSRMYVQPKNRRFKFNDDGSIDVCDGITKKDVFIPNMTDAEGNYAVCHSLNPDVVAGFIRTSKMVSNGQIWNR
jgi:hypothetical protein